MIGRLRGTLLDVSDEAVLIEAGGVGYEVEISLPARAALPSSGEEAVLHTHLVVRDDAHQLYGFATRAERDLFRVLIRTSGVGPKLGLAVLSTISPGDVVAAVMADDPAAFARVPGVGKKTAARLLMELKDRVRDVGGEGTAPARRKPGVASPSVDAEHALVALGYRPVEATRMIAAVVEDGLSTEELIRRALRAMTAGADA